MHTWTTDSAAITPWGMAFVTALFVTWFWSRRVAGKQGIDTSHIDLLVPLALCLGISGAWLWWQLAGYRIRLYEIMICSAAVVFVYSRIASLSFRHLLDVLILPALLGTAVLRIGCFVAGCCWGDVAESVPGIEYPVGSFAYQQHLALGLIQPAAGSSLPVHAVQIYEIIVLLAVILLGLRVRRSGYAKGALAFYGASTYAIGRFFLEFLRADSDALIANLTIVHLQSVGLLALVILVRLAASAGQGRSNPPRAA